MSSVNLLIKPASSLCNMRCRYCFYADEAASRTQPSMGLMSTDTAALLIRRALDDAGPFGDVNFTFQGGEPTMAGLDFYRHFVETVHRSNGFHCKVTYCIQTNGSSLDEAWVTFFAEHHFLVGVSIDGDKALHDEFRMDASGKGTWTRVQKNLSRLQKAGVACNLLCVVTRRSARCAVRTYNTLKKTGIRYLQFIPCLDPLNEAPGLHPWSLLPDDYGNFLCALFDEWYLDWKHGQYTSIRLFDDYVYLAMGRLAGTCATCGNCGGYFAVEADGSVYPCDFYVLDDWRLGALRENSFAELRESAGMQHFLQQGHALPDACRNCEWMSLCHGGCQRNRIVAGSALQNYFCSSFRQFFSYTAPRLQEIANAERQARGL